MTEPFAEELIPRPQRVLSFEPLVRGPRRGRLSLVRAERLSLFVAGRPRCRRRWRRLSSPSAGPSGRWRRRLSLLTLSAGRVRTLSAGRLLGLSLLLRPSVSFLVGLSLLLRRVPARRRLGPARRRLGPRLGLSLLLWRGLARLRPARRVGLSLLPGPAAARAGLPVPRRHVGLSLAPPLLLAQGLDVQARLFIRARRRGPDLADVWRILPLS